jgi:biotin-dependent carboxylase-like uncharacterized protein
MSLIIVDPGLWTTVQDAGRTGYRAWGVPVGGAFDGLSAELANALVGNEAGLAVLEFTLRGGVLEATEPHAVALAGAPLEGQLSRASGGGRSLRVPCSLTLDPGDRLVLGRMTAGVRTYLSVRGGLSTPPRLGSRSSERPLARGERLDAAVGRIAFRHLADPAWESPSSPPIRVIDGPDHGDLTDPGLLDRVAFQVGSRSNRVGLNLESPPLAAAARADRLSAPLAAGAIQLAGERLIILGVASGTLGGYPHVAHVVSADLRRVGQLRPGDVIRFRHVSLDDARRLDREARRAHRDLLLRVTSVARDG